MHTFNGQCSYSFLSPTAFYEGMASGNTGVNPTPDNVPIRDYREIDFLMYVQDDWKVSPKLSLNLGLRYEPMTNPNELHNNLFAIPNIMTDTN
jgi:outer membrane receptor protein involved in Fe transport